MTAYEVHFRRSVMFDAFLEADKSYWLRRAQAFEDARPRATDYTGKATAEEIEDQWQHLTAMADACRGRAAVAERLRVEMGFTELEYGADTGDRAQGLPRRD